MKMGATGFMERGMKRSYTFPESLEELMRIAENRGANFNIGLYFHEDGGNYSGYAEVAEVKEKNYFIGRLKLIEHEYIDPEEDSPHTDLRDGLRGIIQVRIATLQDAVDAAEKLMKKGAQVKINGDTVDVAKHTLDKYKTTLKYYDLPPLLTNTNNIINN